MTEGEVRVAQIDTRKSGEAAPAAAKVDDALE
jgi:hypothetical protein